MLWDENRIVVERINTAFVTEAVLTQLAVASLFNKDSAKNFDKQCKRLSDGS